MKKKLLIIFGIISCWISSYSQAPDLIYYKFEDSSQVLNYATDPVGWLPAIIGSSLSTDIGGFSGTRALKGIGGPRTGTGLETGWNTDISKSFTFSFWFYNSDSLSLSTNNYVFGDSVAGISCLSIITPFNGNVLMMLQFPGSQFFSFIVGSYYVPHVIHYVYDDRPVKGAPYGRYNIYIDGALYNGGNLKSPWTDPGSGLVLGNSPKSRNQNNFYGKLDEFRWYDRALTANEIANTYAIDVNHLGECSTFSSFTMDSISGGGAKIHWTPGPGNTSYFLEYDTAGFVPGTGTVFSGTYPSDPSEVILTGLNPETAYDVYLVEICGSGDSVYTRAPYSFETTEPCQIPVNVTVNEVTPTSAELNWNLVGTIDEFYLIYGTKEFDPRSSGNIDTVSNTMSHTLNNLQEGTWYDVYIVANCGSGYIGDTVKSWFKTECSPVQAPFFEGFEDSLTWNPRRYYIISSTVYYDKDTLGGCWNRTPSWIAEGLSDPLRYKFFDWAIGGKQVYGGPGFGQGGDGGYLYTTGENGFELGEEAVIYTPFVDVSTLAKPYLSFYYHRYGTYQPDCYVEVNDGSGWTTVITMRGPHQLQQNASYDSTGIDISSFGDTVQARFRTVYIGNGGYMGLDNVAVKEAPPEVCKEVIEVANYGMDQDSSVTIDVLAEGHTFNFEWGPVGFAQGTGCLGQGVSPFTIDSCIGLNTVREIYVQNNCQDSGLGVSPYAGPFEFCTPFTAPYSNDFDHEILEDQPQCWVEYSRAAIAINTQGASVYLHSGRALSDKQVLRLYDELPHAGDTFMALSPRFVDMPQGNKQIRFVAYTPRLYKAPVDDQPRRLVVGTMPSYTNGADFHPIDTVLLSRTEWTEYSISLNPSTSLYNGTDQIIAFRYLGVINSGITNYCLIDNFHYEEEPSCLPPDITTLKPVFVVDNRAEIHWITRSSGNVSLEWGEPGFVPGTGNSSGSAVTADTSFMINGLSPQTDYEVYIRVDCGGSQTYWVGPLKFRTACSVSAPYFEDFDGPQWYAPSRSLNIYNCGDNIDNCWSRIGTCEKYDGSSSIVPNYTWGTGGLDEGYCPPQDHSRNGNFIFSIRSSAEPRGDTARIYSPVIDISPLNNPYLTFYYHRARDMDYPPDFWVSLNNGDGQGWRRIIFLAGESQLSCSSPFRQAGVDLSSYGDTIQLRFEAGVGEEMAIDDVRIDEAPACGSTIGDISADNILDSSSGNWTTMLGWEDLQQLATAYEVRIGSEGFTDSGTFDGIITDTTTSKFYLIDTLQPNTCYEFVVRPLCGANTASFEGPFRFCTSCEPEVAPYLHPFYKLPREFTTPIYKSQTFEGGTDCWRGEFNPDSDYSWLPSFLTSSSTGPQNGLYNGDYAFVRSTGANSEDGDVAMLYSPIVDIRQLTTPELSFYYHMFGTTIDTLHLDLYDGKQWYNSVVMIGGSQQAYSTDPWKQKIVDLDTFDATGFIQARFRVKKIGDRGDVAIDEFRIGDSLTCPYPVNFRFEGSLTTETALKWSGDVAGNYVIEYGPSGYTFGEGTEIIVNGDSVVIPVNDNRMYHGYIRSICGPGDTSDAVGPLQFNSRVFPCDDLEAYAPGPLDNQSSLFRPWNAIPGQSAVNGIFVGDFSQRGDEEISTAQSVSGTQSLHLYEGPRGGSGVFTNIEEVKTGIHKISFDIFIADTGGAVYQIYTYKNSIPTATLFFNGMNRRCEVYKYYNGSPGYFFPFTGGWNKMEHIIDIDSDTTWMVVNKVDINIGWKYRNPYNALPSIAGVFFLTTPDNFNFSGAASDFYIDDFCVEEFECPVPSALVVDQSSCTQAIISWIDGINGSATLLEYGTTGFVRGTGVVLDQEANRDTLTSLTPGESYDVYVGEICGYDTVFTGPLTVTLPTEAIADFTVEEGEPTASHLTVEFDGSASVAAMNYSWDFGDGNTGTGVNPSYIYTLNGNYSVRLIIESDCGNDTITKTVIISGISMEENLLSRSLEVYPNPFRERVQISFETQSSEDAAIYLTDLSGKIVMERHISDINGHYEGWMDLSYLAKGSYMLRIESGDLRTVRKIIRE